MKTWTSVFWFKDKGKGMNHFASQCTSLSFRSSSHLKMFFPSSSSGILFQKSQDLGMSVDCLCFAFLPDCLKGTILDPADLDSSSLGWSWVTVNLKLFTVVVGQVSFELSGWSSVSSRTTKFNVNLFRHRN